MENVQFYQNRFFNYILVQKRRGRFTYGQKEVIRDAAREWRLMSDSEKRMFDREGLLQQASPASSRQSNNITSNRSGASIHTNHPGRQQIININTTGFLSQQRDCFSPSYFHLQRIFDLVLKMTIFKALRAVSSVVQKCPDILNTCYRYQFLSF
jgi:hypothetical protein